jgi:hypothetical protein
VPYPAPFTVAPVTHFTTRVHVTMHDPIYNASIFTAFNLNGKANAHRGNSHLVKIGKSPLLNDHFPLFVKKNSIIPQCGGMLAVRCLPNRADRQ